MHTVLSLLAPLLLTTGADRAPTAKAPGLAIAEHNACLGCHRVDEKTVGPSFREIAERYRRVPEAEEKLFAKVKYGGKGAWGEKLAMPHNIQVPDEEIRTLVRWVLALPCDTGADAGSAPDRVSKRR